MHDIKIDVVRNFIIFFPDQNPLLRFIFQTVKHNDNVVHLAQINAIMSCNQ